MIIADLFERDVAREIPPVIYFHETTPAVLQSEVDEYIVTGGYEEGDHRKKRVEQGIHEQYVRLLRAIVAELENPSGKEPASWISGFYGSGKSSFAKMLGLALDEHTLPDGRTFADAWLERNQTPRRREMLELWQRLNELVDPVSVVFDIGGSARDEPIHVTVLRETLKRFGYAVNARVAYYELMLEQDAYYDAFTSKYAQMFNRSWDEGKLKRTSDADVSAVMHELRPETFDSRTAWMKVHARQESFSLGPNEVRDAIAHILEQRAPGKTLFLVIDEVSQYIIGQEQRMLHMQSLNSALAHLRGKVWLLATGQQKLEEQDASSELGKMKARFPTPFRVHLGEQNIREVVHKRLLKKTPQAEETLRQAFQKSRHNLRLYAYDCAEITEEDFVEVYPLLPGHIGLLLDITTEMRHRSSKMQGDSHSVRGLMQLLGDLFRERKLAGRPMGDLITFDDIYDVQASSLDVDTQRTMEKIRAWSQNEDGGEFAYRVAKVVALLQLVQEERPTKLELVAQCLYNNLDRGPTLKDDVEKALERLRTAKPAPLVSYSERTGFRLESSARAEWNKERDEISIPSDRLSTYIQDRLGALLDVPEKPRLKGVPLPYEARYSDSRGSDDVWLKQARGQAAAPLDFRLVAERTSSEWIRRSSEDHFKNRLVWLAGQVDAVFEAARNWAKSKQMIQRYEGRRDSLTLEKQQLLLQERAEEEQLARKLQECVSSAFLDGAFFFRGRELRPRDLGETFGTALEHAATTVLEDLYPHFTTLQITAGEMDQLFKDSLAGASTKFTSDQGGLGILDYEAGQLVAKCEGTIPRQILHLVEEGNGTTGAYLFDTFSSIPYGYSSSVIKACLLGLLRAHKLRIVPRGGGEVTSYADPGTQDLFSGERDLRNADFYPRTDEVIGPRTLAQIAKTLEQEFGGSIDREIKAITAVTFENFPARRTQLAEVRDRLAEFRVALPTSLTRLESALNGATASTDPNKVVTMLWNKLDDLRNGFQQLNLIRQELTDETAALIDELRQTLSIHYAQLADVGPVTEEVEAAAEKLREQLALERPWKGVADAKPSSDLIREAYVEARRAELDAGGSAVETARDSIKLLDGFAKLDADESNHVLAPFRTVIPTTDAHATHPSLAVLRARRGTDLDSAVREARERLDDYLIDIVTVSTGLNGKLIRTQDELEAALETVRDRVSERLSQGKEVRLQD